MAADGVLDGPRKRKRFLSDPSIEIPSRTRSRYSLSLHPNDQRTECMDDSCSSSADSETSSSDWESTSDTTELEIDSDEFEQELPSTSCSLDDKPLYDGAQSGLTIFVAHLLLFQYTMRHSLTAKALEELLNLLAAFLPPDAAIPTSVYQVKAFFTKRFPEQPTLQKFCSNCHRLLSSNELCQCNDGSSHFVTVNLASQLQARLENTKVWNALKLHNAARASGVISDIHQGKKYPEMFVSQGNITLTTNTDGVQLFKSSNVSMWPIWAIINELPPNMRYSKKNMVLCGLWCDAEKPTMNFFLKPLIDSANELYHNGIEIRTPVGRVLIKVAIIVMSCDLPARALVLNMKQFNGQHGCHLCEDEGCTTATNRLFRWWPYQSTSVLRTKESLAKNSVYATMTDKVCKGVKSASIMSLHPPFDLCHGFAIDSLHCVFLGIVRKLLDLWFSKNNRKSPFSIRSKIQLCDTRLLGIKIPDCISRTPRSLTEVKRWKGSEFRSWILFYSLPVVTGILPLAYFNNYTLLVSAVHILMSDHIPLADLNQTSDLLMRFYKGYMELYGEKNCTMNVHLVSHLKDCVEDWGHCGVIVVFSSNQPTTT